MASDLDISHVVKAVFQGGAIIGIFYDAVSLTTAYRMLPGIQSLVNDSPQRAARQFDYWHGDVLRYTLPLNVLTVAITGGLAWSSHRANSHDLDWQLWTGAAGVMSAGVVWIVNRMLDPTRELRSISQGWDAAIPRKDTPHERVNVALNTYYSLLRTRAIVPWVAAGLSLGAVLRK